MFSLRRRYKILIVIVLAAISFYAALVNFNIINLMLGRGGQNRIDSKTVDQMFSSYPNFKKITMNYEVPDFPTFNNAMQGIFASASAQGAIRYLYNEKQPAYYLAIFELPDSLTGNILGQFRSISGYHDETSNSAPHDLNISIEENLKNKTMQMEAFKQKYSANNDLSDNELSQIGLKIDRIQGQIDSLRNLRETFAKNTSNDLVLLKVTVNHAANRSMSENLKGFLKTFVITFFILTALFFLIFFAISLTLRLMSYFGIRSAHSSSGGYYNRSYGSYGGYGHHRKVKRIYKNRDSESEDDTTEKQ